MWTGCDSSFVSFDVFIQPLGDAKPTDVDLAALRVALTGLGVDAGDTEDFATLETEDGGLDVYGFATIDTGLMCNRIDGLSAWDAIVRLADAGDLAILPTGSPIAVTNRAAAQRIAGMEADGVPQPPAIVRSGEQLLALVQEQIWSCPACFGAVLQAKPYETWPPTDFANIKPPYEQALGKPSYEVCPSCGFEFGNDDNPGTAPGDSFDTYRARWEQDGSHLFADGQFMPAFGPIAQPEQNDHASHRIEIVARQTNSRSRWKCSCGESSGGRWFGSPEEATKAAERHLRRVNPSH